MNCELAYLLGYFFADGSLGTRKSKLSDGSTKIYKQSRLEVSIEDNFPIKYCLNKCNIIYTIHTRKRKHWKDQTLFIISKKDKYINHFENILSNKNNMNYIKNIIPENLIYYFIRGFFDGDGSIYLNIKHYTKQIVFSGPINYDWSFLLNLLATLEITASSKNTIRKNNHKYSNVRFTKSCDIITFFNYIYPNGQFDFGLLRKFDKLDTVKRMGKLKHVNHSKP
jgi:hypothetical protein